MKTDKNKETSNEATTDTPTAPETACVINFEEFAHFFEDSDMSEEQAREFLQLYWSLALEIMSLGFGFHPVQQMQTSPKKQCGKPPEKSGLLPIPEQVPLCLKNNIVHENYNNATAAMPKAADRKGAEQ